MSGICFPTIDRRKLLFGSASFAAAAWLPRNAFGVATSTREFTLVAAPARASLVGPPHPETDVWCYNGRTPGPDNRQTFRTILGWLFVPLIVAVAAGAWFAWDPAFQWRRPAADVPAALPKDEFERRVRDYILNNPDVIIEAASRFEQRQRAAEESDAATVLKTRSEEILRDRDSPVGGNPNGDVSLVEFFDYNCPYCRQVTPILAEAEAADPRLRVVYKEFPILGPNSTYSAKAALAVHRQGEYVAFHKEMMLDRGVANEAKVLRIAAKIGVDVERMKSEMNDPAIVAMIERNIALAQALRINGTPGFVIGDQIVRGAIDLKTLRTVVQEARGKQ